jgi:signal transduction histidine kinase
VSARRLRGALVLLATALVVPAALLVHRALRGAEAERAARHRAVAERVFDEMERALSELVAREEERPVEAFAGAARMTALPPERFVLGYFQVGADGRVTAPLPPRDAPALAAVERWFALRRDGARDVSKEGVSPAQAPGTTVRLGEAEADPRHALRLEPKTSPALSPASKDAYDALQSLNRGAAERAERQRKLVVERKAPAYSFEAETMAAAPPPAEPRPSAPARLPAAPQEGAVADLRDEVRVVVEPLIGRLADARHLLLYRSVFSGPEAVRQGLVLDVEGLGDELRRRVLGESQVPGAQLAFATDLDGAHPPADGYRYRHRFAEPFDAITGSLALDPLGGDGAGVIYALAALLALTGAIGLFAVHRMVTVAMRFAERRSNFVAAVTHELKTPLTAIRMYGEMLRDDLVPGEEKRREYYRTITAESERLSRLIDNVLEFSRLEKGTREMRLAVGALGPVVEEVAELLRPHAAREGFALRTAIEPGLPPVRFERDALLQVLVNLVDNALKYARGAASREIAIECRRCDRGVAVAVRDHGPGVAGRHLARIFEPFHRGEDELVRTTQGTGLGLALVKSLVERMGGAVGGRNAAGGGFEVCVELPAAGG